MKIGMVIGSPKAKGSASEALLKLLGGQLAGQELLWFRWNSGTVQREELERAAECDVLVFAFPLYVDSVPSHMLRCLMQLQEYLAQRDGALPRICALVNNGFFDARQNIPAVEVIKNWCVRAHAVFAGGLAVGGGGMVSQVYVSYGANGPLIPVAKASERLAERILAQDGQEAGSVDTVVPAFPAFLYKLAAEKGWRMSAKQNGLGPRELHKGCGN